MKIDEAMLKALAAYKGSVTRCRPGDARGRAVRPEPLPNDAPKAVPLNAKIEAICMQDDGAAQWLQEHQHIVVDEAERRRRKKEKARFKIRRACKRRGAKGVRSTTSSTRRAAERMAEQKRGADK